MRGGRRRLATDDSAARTAVGVSWSLRHLAPRAADWVARYFAGVLRRAARRRCYVGHSTADLALMDVLHAPR